jgi:acetyl esterase/lipase
MKERETIPIWGENATPEHSSNDFTPTLDLYPVDTDTPVGAVLIFPGGGYGHRAPHEGETIAREFNKKGIHAFVAQYRVSPNRHPAPLNDAIRSIRIVRSKAAELKIKPDKIAVCGFSAGGHLAGSLGVHYESGNPNAQEPLERLDSRPDALILCYAVNSSGEFANQGSFNNLLGENAPEDMLEKMSLEKQVDENTPPTFLWHTAEDSAVPVENSLFFAKSLSKHNIPFELHVYEKGRHGLGLAHELPRVATWFSLCCEWLEEREWLK